MSRPRWIDDVTPRAFLALADAACVGRAFPLPSGCKFPPPKGATGQGGFHTDDPVWGRYADQVDAALADGGNAGLRLDEGFFAVDLDTKKLSDADWGRVGEEVQGVFGTGELPPPHNTTTPAYRGVYRWHGHYLFRGTLPDRVSGKLTIDGIVVGDVIRPDHRYMATGAGYRCRWWEPQPPPQTLLDWMTVPEPPKRALYQFSHKGIRSSPDCFNPRGLESVLPEGQRNDGLASVAGIIASKPDGHVGLLHEQNRSRCQPPLPDREVEAIWVSVSRYHGGGS